MIFDAIDRNAQNLGVACGPFIGQLCNRAEFSGADRSEVLGVAEQDRPAVADPVVQGDLSQLGRNGQVGDGVANAKCHGFSPSGMSVAAQICVDARGLKR